MATKTEENATIAREMCELGLWKEVLAFSQQWHIEDASDYLALYYIGLGYTGLKEFRKAEAAYRRALAIEPNAAKVWNNLAGLLYEHMNCHSEGIRCMEKALALDPSHKVGWANLATMVGRLGHHERAIEYANKAIALDSEMAEAHLHKGRAALALGEMEIVEEACHALARISRVDTHPKKSEAGDLLCQGETLKIIDLCMEVHRELGTGHDETIYKDALEVECRRNNVPYIRERKSEIKYKGVILPNRCPTDFVIFDKILFDGKACDKIGEGHIGKVLDRLAASNLKLGLLVNFGEDPLTWRRIIPSKTVPIENWSSKFDAQLAKSA